MIAIETQFESWLCYAALSGLVILVVGSLAVWLCREPIHKVRIIQWTFLTCIIVPFVQVSGLMPGIELGLIPESSKPAEDNTSLVEQFDSLVLHLPSEMDRESEMYRDEDSQSVVPASIRSATSIESASPAGSQDQAISISIGTWLKWAWCMIAGALGIWWALGLFLRRRVALQSMPAPDNVREVLRSIAGEKAASIRLLTSSRFKSPVMWGLVRPTIVIPSSHIEDPKALRWGLAHEWCHVESRDFLTRLLAMGTKLICFFQPCFWWLNRELVFNQDLLADAFAAKQGHPDEYAAFLVELSKQKNPQLVPIGLGIADGQKTILRRIRTLLVSSRPPIQKIGRFAAAMIMVLSFAAITCLGAVRLGAGSAEPEDVVASRLQVQDKTDRENAEPGKVESKGMPASGTDVPDQRNKKENDFATITGRIVQNEDPNLRLSYNDLNIQLVENVKVPSPLFPPEFKDWSDEKRKKWAEDFEASSEGKKFIEQRKLRIAAAHSFDIKVEENGEFIVDDVPPGRYRIRSGAARKKIENKHYMFEVFQQIEVEKKVDNKLDLGRVIVHTRRQVVRGEKTPEIELETFDGKEKINNQFLKNKNVLVCFWSMSSPPSVDMLNVVQKTQREFRKRDNFNFELLTVNLDENREEALKYVKDNVITGWHGYAGGWEHKTVAEFGVRSIPTFCLLGADGNVLMTNDEFLQAFRAGKDNLTQMIDDRIAGRELPKAKASKFTIEVDKRRSNKIKGKMDHEKSEPKKVEPKGMPTVLIRDPKTERQALLDSADDEVDASALDADVPDQQKKKENGFATIKGRIVQNEDPSLRLPYNDLNIRLVEHVESPPYQIPPEGPRNLLLKFLEEHGMPRSFDIKVQENGKFIVYDVPPGRYGISGRADMKIENKRYAFEVFRDVEKKVDNKLDLGRVMISARRLLGRGEKTPEIEMETFDGKVKINNQVLKNKNVLMCFWSMSSPPSVDMLNFVEKTRREFKKRDDFVLLLVNLDENRKEALKFVQNNGIKGWHGYAGDWKHKAVTDFGVHSIPALYLLGDDGNVLMTNDELLEAYLTAKEEFTQMIDDRMAGREVPPRFNVKDIKIWRK